MSTKSVTQSREIKNGGDTKLVVSAGTWRKKGYVDIRNYWRSPDGEWHPTKRGVRVDQRDAVHIAAAVHNLIDELWPVAPKPTPSRNGRKPRAPRMKTEDRTFPNRTWPKNKEGGIKVTPYPMKRTRHDGIRCYGSHVGSKCYKYDYSAHPPIPQAIFISSDVGEMRDSLILFSKGLARAKRNLAHDVSVALYGLSHFWHLQRKARLEKRLGLAA
jgi:hypothetical protein